MEEPTEDVISWIRGMEEAGLKIAIASNNHKERVDRFNEKLGVLTMYESGKPSRKAVRTACDSFSVKPSEMRRDRGSDIYRCAVCVAFGRFVRACHAVEV